MNRRRFLLRGMTLAAALAGMRAWADPRALQVGIDTCPYCGMAVIDGRFASEAITEGGRTLVYDAIECQLDHEAGHGPPPPEVSERWLADRLASARDAVAWLDADEAWLLHHPRLRTPMGGGLAAFASEEEARTFAREQRLDEARLLSWAEAAREAAERPWVPPW